MRQQLLAFLSGETDHRSLPRRFRSILGEKRIQLNNSVPQPLPFRIYLHNSSSLEGLGPNLDSDLRMCHQVVIPIGISWCALIGGNYYEAIVIEKVRDWSGSAWFCPRDRCRGHQRADLLCRGTPTQRLLTVA